MRSATLIALLAAIALGLAGCGGAEDVSPLPETVVGTVPQATTAGPTTTLKGDAEAGKDVFAAKGCGACHTLAAAGSSGTVGPNLDDDEARRRPRRRPRHERQRRDAAVQGPALRAADRRRRGVRGRRPPAADPPGRLPAARRGARLRPRPDADRRGRRAAAAHDRGDRAPRARPASACSSSTGRMFRSVRPYLARAGIEEPVVCYQGAAVVDPGSGRFLRHEPIPLEAAREAIDGGRGRRAPAQLLRRRRAVRRRGHPLVATPTRTSSTSR